MFAGIGKLWTAFSTLATSVLALAQTFDQANAMFRERFLLDAPAEDETAGQIEQNQHDEPVATNGRGRKRS